MRKDTKPTPKAWNEHREGHNTKPETARTAEKGGHEKRRRERERKGRGTKYEKNVERIPKQTAKQKAKYLNRKTKRASVNRKPKERETKGE